ncbi:carbohydrate porin [Poriferisphaera sp. WC338]|uniref:carbohydrate porin n=1 Tax=Poriferisphaera sp. WC338 TaxID=3425129 RepID=UPI003D819523
MHADTFNLYDQLLDDPYGGDDPKELSVWLERFGQIKAQGRQSESVPTNPSFFGSPRLNAWRHVFEEKMEELEKEVEKILKLEGQKTESKHKEIKDEDARKPDVESESGSKKLEEKKKSKPADHSSGPPHEAAPGIMPLSNTRSPINLDPLLFDSPIPPLRDAWEDFKFDMVKEYRVRSNIYDTTFYQNASEVIGNQPSQQLFNRLDFGLIWEVLRHEPQNFPYIGNGWVEFLMRAGVNLDQSSRFFNLNSAIGAISGVDSLYQPNNVQVNILSYTQSFFDDQVLFTAGKLHPNQYIALITVADDESLQFLSGAFDGGQVIPAIGAYAPGLAVQVIPNRWFEFHGLMVNNDATPGDIGFNTLNNGDFGFMGDFIFKPLIKNRYQGRYHVIVWQSQVEGKSGVGFSFIGEQHIGHGVVPFIRYGFGDTATSIARQQVAGGITVLGPFRRIGDMIGVAAAWTDPSDSSQREETNLEFFYRVQVTNYTQISPDFQVIFNPANNPTSDPIFLWGVRMRVQF